MSNVNGEQVKTAVLAAGINFIHHHNCTICGYMTGYIRRGEHLFFDPGCHCGRTAADFEPRSWQEAAGWINTQSNEAVRVNIARRFGIDLTVANEDAINE